MERSRIKEEEIKYLKSENEKNPELFKREAFVDSPDFLEKIGIFFGENKNLPQGYLKLWPSDFIVEEMCEKGELKTVNSGSFFDINKNFLPGDPTIYATLIKCKLPTFEATKDLSEALEIDSKKIQFAGIKDADAITSQLISIRGYSSEKIKAVNSPYYFLKDVYSGKGVVEIGSLKGNKFTLLIRINQYFNKIFFEKKIEEIKENGFYNFFYSQRFGSPRFINWFWGLLIMRGDYRNAILSFLSTEGQREVQYFKNIRKQIKDNFGDWNSIAKIIEPLPMSLQNETKIIKYLQKNPQDFVGALKQVSDQVQLWVFAYSSLLFNRKISEYIANKTPVPKKLPLLISDDKNDWAFYHDFLEEDELSALFLKNLRPFADIQHRKREINTKIKAEIYATKFVPEGVILSFFLPKGCYATTFLSHFFQLTSGLPPADISDKIIDTKEILEQKPITEVIEKFKPIIFSKTENIFEKLE